ncbi:MAG: fluoride efflux transporter CrcB [Planctomycetes bacterium]|nr:fluoride efflux transporter CrcB [Planctomycetota bacterium]
MVSLLTHPVFLLTIGGALGTNARYWLGEFISARSEEWFPPEHGNLRAPLAILVINVSGSLLLGLLVVPLRDRLPNWNWWILLGVGFCGGYTTFSSFAVDTVELVRKYHQPGMAVLNVVASVVVSCLVVWIAIAGMETVQPAEPAVMEAADRENQKEP